MVTARKGSGENAVAEVRQAKSNPRSLFHAHKAGNCTEPDFPPPCARRSWPQGHESLLSCSPLYPQHLGQCMAHSGYWINMCEGWLPAPSFSSRLGPTPLIECPWPWQKAASNYLVLSEPSWHGRPLSPAATVLRAWGTNSKAEYWSQLPRDSEQCAATLERTLYLHFLVPFLL